MNTPSVLLGYERSPDSMTRDQGNKTNATYLSVFITIEPPLTAPERLKEKVSVSSLYYFVVSNKCTFVNCGHLKKIDRI